MKNTTMTKGIVPMIESRTRIRIERSQSAHLLAPVTGAIWGTTPSADAHSPALRGGIARGCGYAPAATDQLPTTLTTPFMDVDDLRSGRPPV
ncbi:hypothetical protein [Lapillicoccus sp.]|uniref:hypothetical protein n=1 Tax=Lapillicoccus sp. TaxID=1909287 RepID=UPI0025FDA68F|nr:hypothetical protein [Lapillicoccus sp.]